MAWEDLESKLAQLESKLLAAEKTMRTVPPEEMVFTVPSFRDYWRTRLIEERMLREKRFEREKSVKEILKEQIDQHRVKIKELEWRLEQLASELNQQRQLWEEKLKTKDAEYKLALKIKEEECRLEQGVPVTRGYPADLELIEAKKDLERRLEEIEGKRIEEKRKWEEEKEKLENRLVETKKDLERRLEEIEGKRIEEKRKWEEEKERLEKHILEAEKIWETRLNEEIKKIDQQLRKEYEETSDAHEQAHLHTTGEMARGFGHRLRNSMGIVSGLAQIVLSDPVIKGGLKESLESIVKTIDEMIVHIDDFIKLLYIPGMVLRPSAINPVLGRVLDEIKSKCKEQNIEIVRNFSTQLSEVKVDVHLIEQALLNILINAIEAMPTGGTLTLETTLEDKKKEVVVRIVDTGVGISDHQIDKVYQFFFTTKKGAKGVGLSQARRIIDLHHGLIKIESVKDKGTTVTIKLPAVIE